jgi:hypothetical protein
MTKREKLEQRVRENPRNVSLEDFEALVWQYGYIKMGGKHPKAILGNRTLPFKRLNPVDQEYMEQALDIIDRMTGRKVN